MHHNTHMRHAYMRVLLQKVIGQYTPEELGRVDRVEFGHDVDGLFLRVGGDDVGVVCGGPGGGYVAFEEGADGHFGYGLGGVRIAVDFVEADVVFAVAGVGEGRHGAGAVVEGRAGG